MRKVPLAMQLIINDISICRSTAEKLRMAVVQNEASVGHD